MDSDQPRKTKFADGSHLKNYLKGAHGPGGGNDDEWNFKTHWDDGDFETTDYDPILYIMTDEDDSGKVYGSAYFLLVQTTNGPY